MKGDCNEYLLLKALWHLDKRNSFMLVAASVEEGEGLWVPKILLLFRLSLRGDSEIWDYSFLQYMEVMYPIDTEDTTDGTLGYVCPRLGSDQKVDHGQELGTAALEQGHLSVGEWFGMQSLQTVERYLNVLRAKHAIHPFTGRIPWPLRRFYVRRFFDDRKFFC